MKGYNTYSTVLRFTDQDGIDAMVAAGFEVTLRKPAADPYRIVYMLKNYRTGETVTRSVIPPDRPVTRRRRTERIVHGDGSVTIQSADPNPPSPGPTSPRKVTASSRLRLRARMAAR